MGILLPFDGLSVMWRGAFLFFGEGGREEGGGVERGKGGGKNEACGFALWR